VMDGDGGVDRVALRSPPEPRQRYLRTPAIRVRIV
jgi:hypothetical protein